MPMESPTQTSNTPSRTTPGPNPDAGPAQYAPRVAGDSPAPTPPNATLRDFVTDGSVAALCDELARVTGSPIWLRDQSGLCIIAEWSEPEGPGHAGDRDGLGRPRPARVAAGHRDLRDARPGDHLE